MMHKFNDFRLGYMDDLYARQRAAYFIFQTATLRLRFARKDSEPEHIVRWCEINYCRALDDLWAAQEAVRYQ